MATHAEFRTFYSAARKALREFRYMRDAGPFHGHYFRRGHMWDYQNGWTNLKAGGIAAYYEIHTEMRKATGRKYRRAELAILRVMRLHNRIAARLP